MTQVLASSLLLRSLLLLLVFAAVTIGAYLAAHRVAVRRATTRRLFEPTATEFSDESTGSLRSQRVETAWQRLVNTIEARGLNLGDSKNDLLREKMVAAGFSDPHAARLYTLIRLVLVIALPILALGLLWRMGTSLSVTKLYFVLVISACIGLYGPTYYVRFRASKRQQELINGFPDALDLMLICVEAGLGLEASFARVGKEMTTSHPLLAEEFGAIVLELRAGRSHEDALRHMADRAGADDIRAFATLLVQSTKLGSSIAQTLRVYASEMREKRRMRAEERAHRLPVLISIPLVACMLPAMIGVLMLPVAIRVIRTVVPALQGS